MKKLLFLFCIIIYLNVSGQDYITKWETSKEDGVMNYEVQSSPNKINWSVFSTVLPKKKDYNYYSVTLPRSSLYFRVVSKLQGNNSFATKPIFLDTSFNISGIETPSRVLSFYSDNEPLNFSHYTISQSQSLTGFSIKQHLLKKGNSKYTSTRFATKYKYFRITANFKVGASKILTTRLIK